MDYPQRDFTHDEIVGMLARARSFATPHRDYSVFGCDCPDCVRRLDDYLITEGFAPPARLVPDRQPWIARPARVRAA